jgi:DNA-binding FadR family transcriptional regulator
MDLTLTPELAAFRDEVRAFLDAHRDAQKDGVPKDMKAWQKTLIAHGYAARTIPKEYGGFGAEPDILRSRIIAEAFIEANARFHAGWHALVGNRRLLRAIDVCAGHVRYLRVLTLNVPGSRKAALAGMRRILAALRRHDEARAAHVMREHLRVARAHLLQVLDDIARETGAAGA